MYDFDKVIFLEDYEGNFVGPFDLDSQDKSFFKCLDMKIGNKLEETFFIPDDYDIHELEIKNKDNEYVVEGECIAYFVKGLFDDKEEVLV